MNNKQFALLVVGANLTMYGLLAGLCEAVLLWKRDGHPTGLILFLVIVSLGGIAISLF